MEDIFQNLTKASLNSKFHQSLLTWNFEFTQLFFFNSIMIFYTFIRWLGMSDIMQMGSQHKRRHVSWARSVASLPRHKRGFICKCNRSYCGAIFCCAGWQLPPIEPHLSPQVSVPGVSQRCQTLVRLPDYRLQESLIRARVELRAI